MKKSSFIFIILVTLFFPLKSYTAIQLFVLRHGQAKHNVNHLMSSSSSNDICLTEIGNTQIQKSAKELVASCTIDYIFSSPLLRTQQTARIVANEAGIPITRIIFDDRLREQCFGNYEGKTYDEYIAQFDHAEDEFLLGAANGESGNDVFLRVKNFLEEIASSPTFQEKNILIVTHAYPLCQMSKYLTNKWDPIPETGQWMQFTLESKKTPEAPTITSYNGVSELYTTKLTEPLDLLIQKITSISDEQKYRWDRAKIHRETIDFGIVFPALEGGKVVDRPMPDFIMEIRKKVFETFKDKIKDGQSPDEFDNCIVSIYKKGDGIAPHIDRRATLAKDGKERNYYFGDSILGLVLKPDSKQSLYFIDPLTGQQSKLRLNEQPGLAYLFQGDLRQTWQHGLDPVEDERITLTFRKVQWKK